MRLSLTYIVVSGGCSGEEQARDASDPIRRESEAPRRQRQTGRGRPHGRLHAPLTPQACRQEGKQPPRRCRGRR